MLTPTNGVWLPVVSPPKPDASPQRLTNRGARPRPTADTNDPVMAVLVGKLELYTTPEGMVTDLNMMVHFRKGCGPVGFLSAAAGRLGSRLSLMEWMPPPDGIAMCQGGDVCASHE